jgi:hypothetical protein
MPPAKSFQGSTLKNRHKNNIQNIRDTKKQLNLSPAEANAPFQFRAKAKKKIGNNVYF